MKNDSYHYKKISYLGIAGSNSYLAAQKYFPNNDMLIGKSTITDVFESLQKNECDFGVVPIENSTTGAIIETYDALLSSHESIFIQGEVVLQIHHHLATNKQSLVSLNELKTCYSHQQAFAQCRTFLKKIENLSINFTSDTASAAKLLAEKGDLFSCAIVNKNSANLYGLQIREQKIEDTVHNFTRFAIVGKEKNKHGDKVSIIYSVVHMPGSLVASLTPFAQMSINLTKIESRPLFAKAWEYIFMIDLEIRGKEKQLYKALAQLKEVTNFITILGIYKKGVIYET